MRRAIPCAVLLLAGCGPPAPPAGRPAQAPPTPPADDRALDPAYTPREQDRATLVAGAVPGFARPAAFDAFSNAPEGDDPARLEQMIESGELVELGGGVPVLVLRNLDPADAREPGRRYAVEVRLLAGPGRGEAWFVDEAAVVRLVPGVAHRPLAAGSYATVAAPGATAHDGWGALDPGGPAPGDAAGRGGFRLGAGARVIILEVRGEAARVRVAPGSEPSGRIGVVAGSGLRPAVPPSRPPR